MAYPYVAVEEALVNGVYHRAYDGDPEPLKVYLYPDRMEITSYPGPPAGLERHDSGGASPQPSDRRTLEKGCG